ncbi:unnamed protein product [Angiostrongylus costaricensis]|uniref:I-EGF_1 domain-containing protein n=1 Tax=Angiostrongylus costaricensis TaxID=334426 RepID=A0A0R3PRE0_ANGCS|nr:unnamed protein product [Angiostrongylus costaricensis]
MPLGSPGSGKSIVQIEPQQVVLRMKPGDSLSVPYKYLHRKPPPGYDVRDFMVQTSEYKKLGVNMEFFVECNGREMETKHCPEIKEGQKLNFKIKSVTTNLFKITLLECRDGADAAISVGVHGYTTVSALYITPLCGCECEKPSQQEKNSPLCHQHGNLICGQCVCEATRGGDKCECPLATYGTVTASIPEKEETPEDGPSENNEAEENIEDTADTDERTEHDDKTAPPPETTENDYSPEPGTPEEATSASYIISVSGFTTLIALALI